jgi:hypothetical protein
MFKKAGVGVAVLVAALVVMAVGSSSASAADTVACGFNGETGSISPPMYLQGGFGNFTFGAVAVCSVNGGPPTWGSLNAGGSYVNSFCGTFVEDGNFDLTVGGGAHVYSTVLFHIDFVGGVGKVLIQSPANGNGAVQIAPTGTQIDGVTCMTQMTMTGSFAGTF